MTGARQPALGVAPGSRTKRVYSTTFPLTENPISESGNWVLVQDRTNFRSAGGVAYGTQPGGGPTPYNDSITCLSGPWRSSTRIETVLYRNGSIAGGCETEHIHLCTASVGKYLEVNYAWDGQYAAAVIAKGGGITLADYIEIDLVLGLPAVSDGDRLISEVVGDTFNVWMDRGAGPVAVLSVTDSRITSLLRSPPDSTPAPGIGAYINGSSDGPMANYCFNSFMAMEL